MLLNKINSKKKIATINVWNNIKIIKNAKCFACDWIKEISNFRYKFMYAVTYSSG